jgi:hypothetical protein
MRTQRRRKAANHWPFKITQASSRMNIIVIVKIPPTSSHRHATNNPRRLTPVRLSRKASTGGIGSEGRECECDPKNINKAAAVTMMLQIRAVQRMFLMGLETAIVFSMIHLLPAHKNRAKCLLLGAAG